MHRSLIVACALLLLTTGCSRKSVADPVEQLKTHISYVSNGRDKKFNNEWQNIKYDVEKTNSLTSPYTATISADVYEYNDKRDASPPEARSDYNITLAYRDGEWILKDAKRQGNAHEGSRYVAAGDNETLRPGDVYWNEVEERLRLAGKTNDSHP